MSCGGQTGEYRVCETCASARALMCKWSTSPVTVSFTTPMESNISVWNDILGRPLDKDTSLLNL